MKDFFSRWRLNGWLTKRQILWWILSLGCLFGSYLVWRYLGFLGFLLLVLVGVIMASAVIANVKAIRNGEQAHAPLRWIEKAAEIKQGWDYRPKKASRRDTASESRGLETAKAPGSASSAPNENRHAWFDFMGSMPSHENNRPASADEGSSFTYDQGPIDGKGAIAEQ